MEKIFKKSLALVLSAALCLTALVGCLTVSAEGASATVTVGSVEVNSDATTATVPVTITATGDGIAAAMFELKVDTTKINLSGLWEDIATNIKTESDSIGINVSVSNDGDNVTTVASEDVYRFIVEGVDPTSGENVSIKQFTNASFDLTFNIASGATGENAIEFVNDTHAQACNAGTFNIETGKYIGDEKPFTLTGTNGAVTIKAASTEPVIGVADVNWNASSLAAYHKFNINSFAYDKDYLIRSAYYTSISAGKDISYKFIVKGNGFCVEWGDTKLLSRTGAATLSNLSIANIAYEMTFQLVISYTDASDVQHIDYSEVYTADSRAKIAAISNDKSAALVSLIDTWKSVDTQGFVSVDKPGEAKTFDMTADVTGEADVNWNSTQAALVAAHYVTVSDFKYSKDYLIRGTYYNSLASMNVIASGFIVTGQGFNVQWENEGLISRTGAATLSNLSVFNVSGDMTWKLYIKYIDADGKTHIDYSSVDTNYITKLNNGGALSSESAEAIDAFKSFYELWSAQ